MHLEIALPLSRFGWNTLEKRATADGFEVTELIEQACGYYASELDSRRPALELPKSDGDEEGGAVRLLALELDGQCVEVLEGEARRQEVSLERLVRHATLVYLSDLDAGRVADRVARRVAERESNPVS
jgi:hypothetical protein